MDLLTPELREALRANATARGEAYRIRRRAPDPAPVVRFFNPLGAATWLATELDADGDTLFGLADLGFGCPELGSFSLCEIAALRLPFGLGIERDLCFESAVPLSVWAKPPKVPAMRSIDGMAAEGDTARRAGSIPQAQSLIRRIESAPSPETSTDPDQLPPSEPDGG